MEYILYSDVSDKILSVEQCDIDEANQYLQGVADRLGVLVVKTPISQAVKRLGVVYACYLRAVASVGTDASVTFNGGRHEDVFAQKAEWYGKELKNLSAEITASDFTGTPGKSRTVINLWRG